MAPRRPRQLLCSSLFSLHHSHAFARQFAGLFHPGGELWLVEFVILVNVEVARLAGFGWTGRLGPQRRAAKERDFHVVREAMQADEPAVALDAVKRRVPFDGL